MDFEELFDLFCVAMLGGLIGMVSMLALTAC